MPSIEMFSETRKSGLRLTCEVEHMEHPKSIKSLAREHQRISDGTLLMAKKGNDSSVQIPVDFTGTHLEHTTEFYLGKNDRYQANTLKCCLGSQQYYLCAENENVFLLKTIACDPNDAKFMFEIEATNANYSKYCSIKSVKTEMFLVSDKYGNVSMRKIKDLTDQGQPEDRQAWFELIDDDVVPDSVFNFVREDITFTATTCKVEAIRVTV